MTEGKVKTALERAEERLAESNKVVSIFDKQPLEQPAEAAPDDIEKRGHFKGTLPKAIAQNLRKLNVVVAAKSRVINEMIADYDHHHLQYTQLASQAVTMLGIDPMKLVEAGFAFYISEEGHVWVIEEKFMDGFIATKRAKDEALIAEQKSKRRKK